MKKLVNFLCVFAVLCCSYGAYAQSTVTGKVTDENGIGILGAAVQVQNTNNGTVTDEEGIYSIEASEGDVLVFSYIGFGTKRATVGTSSAIDIQLQPDVSILNEVIVSSTRKPIRKIQSTAAVTNIGIEEIQTKQPESFTEAIENTPGVTVANAQGRKAVFNIRGFPGGNTYTTTLIDGIPASGISSLSGGVPEFFGLDPNVARIEVVRGSAAALFGRAAAAGAVNIISKVGGTEHKGSFSMTKYNNVSNDGHKFDGDFDYRADINFNGPISDKLRYNVGGYVINDSGIKESTNKDKGTQFRANIDWLISEKSSIRFYGTYLNNQFQNITDLPWNLGTNTYAEGWNSASTFYNDPINLDFTATGPVDANGRTIEYNPFRDFKEEVKGGNLGIDAIFHLGNNWYLNQKNRYQQFFWSDINEISFNPLYTTNTPFILRGNFGGFMETSDFINETRFSKEIDGAKVDHNISGGIYYSNGERDRYVPAVIYLSEVNPRPDFFGFGGPGSPIGTDFFTIPGRSEVRIKETALGFFAGDEMVFNEKLSLNLALRYDIVTGFASNDPEEVDGFDFVPETLSETDLDFKDWSWSVGMNYLFSETSAIYANYLRAFSLPTVGNGTDLPEKNEIINNLEIGYRAGLGDLTFDLALFNTVINNRLATEFDTGINAFVQKPVGTNIVRGGELALTYTPNAVKGLLLRGSFTLQQSEFKDFLVPLSLNQAGDATNVDLDGNLYGLKVVGSGLNRSIDVTGKQVANTPKTVFNFNAGYNAKYWGINFGGYTYAGRYGSAFNLYELPNLSVYNAGAYVQLPLGGTDNIKLSLQVKNLFDGAGLQSLETGATSDNLLIQRQATPNFTDVLGFALAQAPKRVLFTVGYSF